MNRFSARKLNGYTLLELLAAVAVLGVILTMLFSTTGMAMLALRRNATTLDTFQQGRAAFSSLTRRLSQATLNNYRDYYDVSSQTFKYSNLTPGQTEYRYRSELHFVCGRAADLIGEQNAPHPTDAIFFQAPIGYRSNPDLPLSGLLNVCGYYVEFGSDTNSSPVVATADLNPKMRHRLYEVLQPSDQVDIYRAPIIGNTWLKRFVTNQLSATSRVLAENVIALILLPQRRTGDAAIAPQYAYDSRAWQKGRTDLGDLTQNQLPPLVQVTMVVIDELSANRLALAGPDRLANLVRPELFRDATRYNADLQQLQEDLKGQCQFRFFQTSVSLMASTWSEPAN